MNWIEIKEKYPKALKKGLERFGWETGGDIEVFDVGQDLCVRDRIKTALYYKRDLFDFFDEQGVYIALDIYWSDGKLRYLAYNFQIKEIDKEFEINELTRTEAEEKAFEKAFEIIERR